MRVAGAVCANLMILARPVAQLATYMYIVLESVCNGSIGGRLGDCEMISRSSCVMRGLYTTLDVIDLSSW